MTLGLPEDSPYKADLLLGYRYAVMARWAEVCKMPTLASKLREKADICYERAEYVYERIKERRNSNVS